MNIFLDILRFSLITLIVLVAPIYIWLFLSQLAGFLPKRKLRSVEHKIHRFAVVICARNEEIVIAQLLDSLKSQSYGSNNYKCIVVADNCTDDTAAIARQSGAIVFERSDPDKKGKGYALSYCIEQIREKYSEEFDALCVFDADNLVSTEFLTEMNKALCSKGDIAIGFRDSKNIHDSWISEANSLYWLIIARTYHMSRQNIGLSSNVGGTGFACKLSILGDEGWLTHTITEDVEFSIQKMCQNFNIVFAKNAIFYDEQPTTFKSSFTQRVRWMTGGLECIPLYLSKIIKKIREGNFKLLDSLWYLLLIPATALTIPVNIASLVYVLLKPNEYYYLIPALLCMIAIGWLYPVLLSLFTLMAEKRKILPMIRGIFLFPIFVYCLMLTALVAIIHPSKEWKAIPHTSLNTIDEMEN